MKQVGEYDVPDNRPTWKIPVGAQPVALVAADEEYAPPDTVFNDITYNKVKTITGTMFVATVEIHGKKRG